MNTFTIEIWFDETKICNFYTVKWVTDNDNVSTETDKFFDKYAIPNHPMEEKALQLFRLITESIGNRYGATDDFFDRIENLAQALPPKQKQKVYEIKYLGINFPLRLYCYRLTQQIVILFNGGIKDANSAQESKDLSMKFYEAQIFVKKIVEAISSGIIEISNDNRIISFNGSEEITL